MRGSLAWRITVPFFGLLLVVLLGIALYVLHFTRSTYLGQLEAQLAAEARLSAGEAAARLVELPPSDPVAARELLQPLAARLGTNTQARITLIGPDGTVLGDSAETPEEMENHAERLEVASALQGRLATSTRRSATVGYEMLYVATPITVGGEIVGVARTALPTAAIEGTLASLASGLAVAVTAAAAASAVLAIWLGRTTTLPVRRLTRLVGKMADGQFDARSRIVSRDEVGELGRAFNRMADRLQETFNAISAERNRLAKVLETMADGLVITDPSGRVVQLNPAAEQLLRVRAADTLGRPFIAVGRDHELAELLATPGGNSRLISLGMPRRQIRALAAEIPGTTGQRLLLLQDLTELRRLENVRRDFVANVSHELRTPIAAIKVLVETLESGALDDPPAAREFLGRMHDEIDQLAELVRELLELSKIESGQAEISPRLTELSPLLVAAVDRLTPLAQRAGLELKLRQAVDLPPVMVDPQRIGQVLANLIHNSIKFTPPGGQVEVQAFVTRSRSDEDAALAEQVAVSVADSGVGIPPDDLDRIFERFFKTDRSRATGGTGLGLAISKHLVQAHGGRVWAESDGPGRGSTFTFTLPLARSTGAPDEPSLPSQAVVFEAVGAGWPRS